MAWEDPHKPPVLYLQMLQVLQLLHLLHLGFISCRDSEHLVPGRVGRALST